jgi:hypothetical protein
MLDLITKLVELGLKLFGISLERPRLKVLIKWHLPSEFYPCLRGYLIVANVGTQQAQIRRACLLQHYPGGGTPLTIWWKDEVRKIAPAESIEYYFEFDASMPPDAWEVIDAEVEDHLCKRHYSRRYKGRKAYFKQLETNSAPSSELSREK